MPYEEESGDILMAFTGDSLISRRLTPYREERFLTMAELLRTTDVAFTNAETLFHEYESAPIPDSGPYGTYAACDPNVIDDLKWLGIRMVSTANNHCYDYGEGGIMANMRNLRAHGMPFAGTGRNLSEAAAPAYLDTPCGSVALIGVTLTMPPQEHRAGDARGVTQGRPGANVLRHTTVNTVPREALDSLRQIARNLGFSGPQMRDDGDQIAFLGQRFVAGDGYSKSTTANQFDLDLNLRWVKDARRMADWVVVSMHNHERGATADEPSQFATDFARACIDAGADAVFGHGPHRERGIEVYKGRPILYALGNFVMHNDLIKWEPWDLYNRYGLGPEATTADVYDFRSGGGTRGMAQDHLNYQTCIARVRFQARQLKEISIHPVDLGMKAPRTQRGRPILAEGEVAQDVLQRLCRLSRDYGTEMQIEGDVGVVRL